MLAAIVFPTSLGVVPAGMIIRVPILALIAKLTLVAVTTRFVVRRMVEGDIPQVVAIEHESFPTSWPQTAYRRELSNNIARYLVVIDEAHAPLAPEEVPARRSFLDLFRRNSNPAAPTIEYLVGYIGVWLMVDDAHVVAVAVREAYRGRGIGELLLAEAIDLAIYERMESVTLEVRKSNLLAQALYEKYRFLKVGVRKRYYSDDHEDAIIMTTPPIQHESYREHMRYLRGLREERNYAVRPETDRPLGSAEEPE